MFQDMGEVPPMMVESLIAASRSWIEGALDAGEYVGWLASPKQASHIVVGGAGVHCAELHLIPYTTRPVTSQSLKERTRLFLTFT